MKAPSSEGPCDPPTSPVMGQKEPGGGAGKEGGRGQEHRMLGAGYSPVTVIPAREFQGAGRLAQTALGLQQPQERPEKTCGVRANSEVKGSWEKRHLVRWLHAYCARCKEKTTAA